MTHALLRLLPARWRESIEGDLLEDAHRRRASGKRAGALWQARTTLTVALRLAMSSAAAALSRSRQSPVPRFTGGIGRDVKTIW